MAKCKDCGIDMAKSHEGCNQHPMLGGMAPIPYGYEYRMGIIVNCCHDCNVAPGGVHHWGCDVEECPKCHGQLISCGCFTDSVFGKLKGYIK